MASQKAKRRRGYNAEETRSRPLSLAALKAYGALEAFARPEGEFDPAGGWRHTYRLWLVGNRWHQYRGFLDVKRGTSDGGHSVDLEVRRSLLMSHQPAIHETTASLTCAGDALCTPRSWEIKAETLDITGKPFPLSRLVASASVKGGRIEGRRGGRTFDRRVPTPFTSDFSLFDVVQRLAKQETKPMRFALLQDLDEVKEEHVLSYRERLSFEIGGAGLALHCYQQIGRGILPYRYYVDGQGRLLFAISGIRAYILDPKVQVQHKRSVERLARRPGK